MKSLRMVFVGTFIALTGCFQVYDKNDDLHTVPVTNNPHVVPNHGSSFPMIGGM